ncbi:hypothetical protein [Phyllobacterium myrsinacearum]|uniref:Uncharacterized protein n=1 Tax=Phyllobacterium myrsinacearum TaxID=28101 RepID=A0A839ELG7_9HYPH|nr:hypothetical protein [Phyllobacterium myrsinacearum]MBA8879055.1 hypothetical protein [Phyllobacterium myrsinacearum]
MGIAFMAGIMPETLPSISHETRSNWLMQRMDILRRNPNFSIAAAEYARGNIGVFEGRYMANKVMANVARRVICMSIMALHFTRSNENHGATISGLQNITSALKLCSKNTTAATIDLLENIGLVTRVPDESDHRHHLIQPTDKLISGTSNIIDIAFTAADKLFPLRNYQRLLKRPDGFMERYFAASLHSLLNVSTLISKIQGSQLFAISDGGGVILCKLMALKYAQPVAEQNIVSLPYDEIGHLYGVSRTHIRRLMQRAEIEGLVHVLEDGGRKIEILPPLDDVFENMVAAHIARVQFDIHLANKDYDLLPIDRYA